jgi:hypothetical protein
MVERLAAMRIENKAGSVMSAFQAVCMANQVDKVKWFFQAGLLEVNQGYSSRSDTQAEVSNLY